ncbi:MAG: hypothetical protein JXB49_14110 [Bacteroidales bacterium]|nr:hypothetical protein [Bacteroidales bacterium]
MDELESILEDFLSYYNNPRVTVKYFDQIDGDDNFLSEEFNITYNEVEVTVNGYMNPIEYYTKLLWLKNQIINKLVQFGNKQSKRKLQINLMFLLPVLKERQTYFEKKQITGSFSYLPANSPKKLVQREEIFCKKEELTYLDSDKNLYPLRGTNERKQISTYYYFMLEILEELISFFEKLNVPQKVKKTSNSFQIKINQPLTDLKNALVARGFIEDIDLKSFNKVFHNEMIEKKINWIGGKEAFKYFISNLIDSKYIHSSRERWKIAEKCFLIKGEEIEGYNISTQQKANNLVQESINHILNNLQK